MTGANDKMLWKPVGALLARFKMKFCGWPLAPRQINFPGREPMTILVPTTGATGRPAYVGDHRRTAANDPYGHPSPEAA